MYAIVLTYDKNAVLTEHMIRCYEDLWSDHPFVFRIPFQHVSRCYPLKNREYLKTSTEIKATVFSLIADLDDEEWVYWCIDDKYPIRLNLPPVKLLYHTISTKNTAKCDAILFCRARKMLVPAFLTGNVIKIGDEILLERLHYHQIWIHQFLKVKVIRHLFLGFPEIDRPRMMDKLKNKVKKPSDHHLFVTLTNHAVFGESSSYGLMTANCYRSIVDKKMNIPDFFEVNHEKSIVIGIL